MVHPFLGVFIVEFRLAGVACSPGISAMTFPLSSESIRSASRDGPNSHIAPIVAKQPQRPCSIPAPRRIALNDAPPRMTRLRWNEPVQCESGTHTGTQWNSKVPLASCGILAIPSRRRAPGLRRRFLPILSADSSNIFTGRPLRITLIHLPAPANPELAPADCLFQKEWELNGSAARH
jgi:hypothetical protein